MNRLIIQDNKLIAPVAGALTDDADDTIYSLSKYNESQILIAGKFYSIAGLKKDKDGPEFIPVCKQNIFGRYGCSDLVNSPYGYSLIHQTNPAPSYAAPDGNNVYYGSYRCNLKNQSCGTFADTPDYKIYSVIIEHSTKNWFAIVYNNNFYSQDYKSYGLFYNSINTYYNGAISTTSKFQDIPFESAPDRGPAPAMLLDRDNQLIIGGNFSSIGGSTKVNGAMLALCHTSEGKLNGCDNLLANNGAANEKINAIALDSDQNLYVGGVFTEIENAKTTDKSYLLAKCTKTPDHKYTCAKLDTGDFSFKDPINSILIESESVIQKSTKLKLL